MTPGMTRRSIMGSLQPLAFPALAGKMDGMAIRVLVSKDSGAAIVVELERPTEAEAVNACLRAAASTPPMAGILAVSDDEMVSVDIIDHPHAAIVDALPTNVLNGTMSKSSLGMTTHGATPAVWHSWLAVAKGGHHVRAIATVCCRA